jgi:hypothetical protein
MVGELGQGGLISEVLFLVALGFPPSLVRHTRYHRTGAANVQQVVAGIHRRNTSPHRPHDG